MLKEKNSNHKKTILTILISIVFIFSLFNVNGENATLNKDEQEAPEIIEEEIEEEVKTEEPNETKEVLVNTNETKEVLIKNDSKTLQNTTSKIITNETIITKEKTNETINTPTSSGSSSNKQEESKTEYINIDELPNITQEKTTQEKTKLICFKDSEKEFEGKVDINLDCNKIKKLETKNDDDNKQVIIKSDQHVNDPITVYTNIPEITESQKENIKIIWKNNGEEITSIDFHDKDDNNLFDQISWTVPHLSEQIFDIIIDLSKDNSSQTIQITKETAPQETATNPIEFEFNVNYQNLNNLECNLTINEDSYNIGIENAEYTQNLPNGEYDWSFTCTDTTNSTNKESTSGDFTINEDFSLTLPKHTYMLGENIDADLTTPQGNISIEIKNLDSGIIIHAETEEDISSYQLNLKDKITQKGNYQINVTTFYFAKPISKTENFSVSRINITIEDSNINTEEKAKIRVDIDSPKKISWIILDNGDGKINHSYNINSNTFDKTYEQTYARAGDYTINLTANIGGETFEVSKNGIKVTSSSDTTEPSINLREPQKNIVLNQNEVTFSFKANDNEEVDNCTFELYNNVNSFGTLDYSTVRKDIENDQLNEIKLIEFEEGDYTWYVECCDNSGNCGEENRDFKINFSSTPQALSASSFSSNITYEKKEELEEATSNLEEFLKKKESYSLDKLEILDELEISKDLKYYQKRLTQIKIELSNNLKFISDEELRATKKQEILDEFEEITGKIPSDISITNKKEFVKNGVTDNLEKIIKSYLEEKGIKNNIKKLTTHNKEIQNEIKTLTKVKKVEIKYLNKTEEVTLITKEIEFTNNNQDETILEIIPKTLEGELIFSNEAKEIKENEIYEISQDDLIDNKLIYKVKGHINSDEIEKTETIIFQNKIKEFGITGFSVYFDNIGSMDNIYYIITPLSLIIVIILIIFNYLRSWKIKKWKKNDNVKKIFKLRRGAKKALKNKEVETAKEKYAKIKELYPSIPKKCKAHLFKDLKKIRIALDEKEIFSLFKEYSKAKSEKRIEDSKLIYKKIRTKYNKLPKKQKEKFYNKMFKIKSPVDEL